MIAKNPEHQAVGLVAFTDERLVESLYLLTATLNEWEWIAATDSAYDDSPEQIGERVLQQLQAAAEAASACIVKGTATEAAT